MHLEQLQPGDIVYAAKDIFNDGTIPGYEENDIVAKKGNRGVLVNIGHLEEHENQTVYLVKFENAHKDLGLAIGCWPEDLTADVVN